MITGIFLTGVGVFILGAIFGLCCGFVVGFNQGYTWEQEDNKK